jgi:hypothetical protein
MLEEKSIYLVFEYAEHDFLVRPLPLTTLESTNTIFGSKSSITTRQHGQLCPSQFSNHSSGNSSMACRTSMTTGSSTATSSLPISSLLLQGRSRLETWDSHDCIKNRYNRFIQATR